VPKKGWFLISDIFPGSPKEYWMFLNLKFFFAFSVSQPSTLKIVATPISDVLGYSLNSKWYSISQVSRFFPKIAVISCYI